MRVSELILKLADIVEKFGDLELVYSSDEEGNSFHKIYYDPSVGAYSDNEFVPMEDVDDEVNAVCIN